MCDYSLHDVASRDAKVGDKLQTTAFANSITRGFCAAGEPDVAVCLRPGTEVAFDQNVSHWRRFSMFPLRFFGYETMPQRVARFRQLNMERAASHHDALEFSDGAIVLVTKLKTGQKATVLQLPPEPVSTPREEVAAEDAPSELVLSLPR
jgi:hypothetical protein